MLPEIVGRDEFAALIIRTDYDDETAWWAMVAKVSRPWGSGSEYEADVHLVDDPAWVGATPEAVLTALRSDEELSVVFVADSTTMQRRSRRHPSPREMKPPATRRRRVIAPNRPSTHVRTHAARVVRSPCDYGW
ncbi:hypothetical protein [Kitasatospora sp. NPDC050463]|uniref:DUF6924 domain-containing protein n=1 Tax=Kitasatospora sp. NPDC050463 TaxID=3155786 RepID=UPI0033C2AAB9